MVSGGGRAAVSAINLEAAFIKLPPYPPASNLPQRSEIPRKYPENIYIYIYVARSVVYSANRTRNEKKNKKRQNKQKRQNENKDRTRKKPDYPQANTLSTSFM